MWNDRTSQNYLSHENKAFIIFHPILLCWLFWLLNVDTPKMGYSIIVNPRISKVGVHPFPCKSNSYCRENVLTTGWDLKNWAGINERNHSDEWKKRVNFLIPFFFNSRCTLCYTILWWHSMCCPFFLQHFVTTCERKVILSMVLAVCVPVLYLLIPDLFYGKATWYESLTQFGAVSWSVVLKLGDMVKS